MKTWVRALFVVIIIASFGGSCSPLTSQEATSMQPATIVPTATILPTTLTPSPTVTNTPVSKMDFSCWPVKPLQNGNGIKGSFVYAHYNHFVNQKSEANSLFAWDLSSFRDEKFTVNQEMNIRDSKVSFNGDTLVILTENNLAFISPEIAQFFPLPKEATTIADLAINDYLPPDGRVLLHRFFRDPLGNDSDYQEGIGLTVTYFVFDPKTNAISSHKVFLPNLYMDWHMVPSIDYSPDMKYVLYKSTPTVQSDQFTLYDLENNKVMWVTPPQNTNLKLVGGEPHWLPYTDVISAEYEGQKTGLSNYYLVSLDGKISPLNDLDQAPGSGMSLHDPSSDWSPNGRYLISPTYNTTYIWDSQTKIYYKPCLPNETKSVLPYTPLWPFDRSYVFVLLSLPSPSGIGYIPQTYILDLANKIIYEMPENINSAEFTTLYKDGRNVFLGWVNWEIP